MDIHPAIRHEPDPDYPGWMTWEIEHDDSFNNVLGRLLVRSDGPRRGRCRMFTTRRHGNLMERVHGGALMTFIDVALFAGGVMAGASVSRAVTLDCNVQFLEGARLDQPLDAEVELLRETGRLAFLQGRLVQGETIVAGFSGALRKASR